MCEPERGVTDRFGADPFRLRRRPDCLSRQITIPSNYEALHQEVLRWMRSCVISRTPDSSGEPIHSEIYLVQNSNLDTLWQSNLQHLQGEVVRICVEYILNDRGLPNGSRVRFSTDSRVREQRQTETETDSDEYEPIVPSSPSTEGLDFPEVDLSLRVSDTLVSPPRPTGDESIEFNSRIIIQGEGALRIRFNENNPHLIRVRGQLTRERNKIKRDVQLHLQHRFTDLITGRLEVSLRELGTFLIDWLRSERRMSLEDFIQRLNRSFTTVIPVNAGWRDSDVSVIVRGVNEFGLRIDIGVLRIEETFPTAQLPDFLQEAILSARLIFRVEVRVEGTIYLGPRVIRLIVGGTARGVVRTGSAVARAGSAVARAGATGARAGATAARAGATAAQTGTTAAQTGATAARTGATVLAAELAIGASIIIGVIAANVALFNQIRQSVVAGERRGLWSQFARGYIMFIFYPNLRGRWFDTEVRDPGSRRITNSRQMARILGIDRARKDAEREGLQEVRDRMVREYLPRFAGRGEAVIRRELSTMITRFAENEFSTGRDPLVYERY